jgi:hypothetical protein
MKMQKCFILTIVALAIAAGAFAKEGKTINLQHDATLAGTHLASDDYTVTWQAHSPGATVSFARKGKVVATAEGKLVGRPKKSPENEVVYGTAPDGSMQILELRFRGSTQAIVFGK